MIRTKLSVSQQEKESIKVKLLIYADNLMRLKKLLTSNNLCSIVAGLASSKRELSPLHLLMNLLVKLTRNILHLFKLVGILEGSTRAVYTSNRMSQLIFSRINFFLFNQALPC